jgi:putative ABC transport system substrate-binding protein
MKRRDFIVLGAGAVLVRPFGAAAQKPAMPVIGFLRNTSAADPADLLQAFRKGLLETGLVEGRNVAIEYRYAENQDARLPALAADLVGRQVDVIMAGGTVSAIAAKAATSKVPIVFAIGSDPVAIGLVPTLGRPGGNLKGVSFLTGTEQAAKRLEFLHDCLPKATTVAYLLNPNGGPTAEIQLTITQARARLIGVQLVVLKASSGPEIDAAFATLIQQRISAFHVSGDAFFLARRDQIVSLAARHRIPATYQRREFVEAGGLLSYGASIADAFRQAGVYAGQILKGAKPGELPDHEPTKFDLVINLKTAKTLGLTVPQSILQRADEVIR